MTLPEPYYDDGQIKIFCADCRDILPMLGRESVDLVLTDPPYGVRWVSGSRRVNLEFGPIIGDESVDLAEAVIPLCLEVLRHHRHIYVFGPFPLDGRDYIRASAELIWDKGMHSGGDLSLPWSKSYEVIQFGVRGRNRRPTPGTKRGEGQLAARLRKQSVLRFPRHAGDRSVHPTQKSVPLLRELIESSSRFGDLILDPFAGSGSTLVAARLEGRRCIGIEIEERYCEIAVKRLRQSVLPLEVPA